MTRHAHRRLPARGALVAVLVVGTLFGAACGGSSGAKAPTEPPPIDLRGRAAVQVAALDNRFEPPRIRIDPGTTVTWVNQGAMVHNIAKAADAIDFGAPFGATAGEFGPGARYAFRFTKPGIFPYACTIHSLMNGVVVVGDVPFPPAADAGGA